MTKRNPLTLHVASVLAMSLPGGVLAQDSGFALEEVMVTAQKRVQSMQDVPISVQAYSSEAMRVLGAKSVSDLEESAPSLTSGGPPRTGTMGLRGVVDFSRNVGIDPRLGVYIDGVYQGQSFTADQPLLGLESVEILRGPQGTLAGKNTVSGAILLNTKNPDENFEGELQAEVGNLDYYKGAAYISGGLTANLFGSVSVAYEDYGDFIDNITLNKDVGSWDRTSARFKLRSLPSDQLELILSGDFSDYQTTEPTWTNRELPPHTTQQNMESDSDSESWGVSLTANYDFENEFTLTSITALREGSFTRFTDDDVTPFDIDFSYFDEDNEQFSQEFRLVSPSYESFDWVAGLYYFSTERNSSSAAGFQEDLFASVLPPPADAFAAEVAGVIAVPATVEAESYAVYLHGNYRFTESLELTAGVRYNYEEKDVEWYQHSTPNNPEVAAQLEAATGVPFTQFPGAAFGAINYSPYTDDRDEDDISVTAGLNYFLGDESMLYAKYSLAHKSGGYNSDFMTAGLDFFEYEPESVDSYEAGLKSTMADGKLRLNASLFLSEFDDFQVFQAITSSSGATTLQLTNAGEATTQGIEIETNWIPHDQLQILLNLAYVDATYDEYENPVPGEPDFSGNKLAYSPEWNVFTAIQYIQPVGTAGSELTMNLSYNYVDERYSDPANLVDLDLLESYEIVNGRIAYTPPDRTWELSLWGKNLADEEYSRTNGDNFLGTPVRIWSTPRTYGLSFTYFMGN